MTILLWLELVKLWMGFCAFFIFAGECRERQGMRYLLLHFLLFIYSIVYIFLIPVWFWIWCGQYHKVALLLWVTKA